jgi:hypothetical protein
LDHSYEHETNDTHIGMNSAQTDPDSSEARMMMYR